MSLGPRLSIQSDHVTCQSPATMAETLAMLQRTYWMMYLEPSSSQASSHKESPSGQGWEGPRERSQLFTTCRSPTLETKDTLLPPNCVAPISKAGGKEKAKCEPSQDSNYSTPQKRGTRVAQEHWPGPVSCRRGKILEIPMIVEELFY